MTDIQQTKAELLDRLASVHTCACALTDLMTDDFIAVVTLAKQLMNTIDEGTATHVVMGAALQILLNACVNVSDNLDEAETYSLALEMVLQNSMEEYVAQQKGPVQ